MTTWFDRHSFHIVVAGACGSIAGYLISHAHRQHHRRLRGDRMLHVAHTLEASIPAMLNEMQAGTLSVAEAVDRYWSETVPDLVRKNMPKGKFLANAMEPEWVLVRRLWYATMRLLHQPRYPVGKAKYVDFQSGENRYLNHCELPLVTEPAIRFVVVSDTHMRHRDIGQLPPGDVLVHCGDALFFGGDPAPEDLKPLEHQFEEFRQWLADQQHLFTETILIGGNHDTLWESLGPDKVRQRLQPSCTYLQDDEMHTKKGNLRVYGSGYAGGRGTTGNSAFQPSDETLKQKLLNAIPNGLDVLITHSPPHLSGEPFGRELPLWNKSGINEFGCKSLLEVTRRANPRVHIFGHDHEAHGSTRQGEILYIAGSTVYSTLTTATKPPIVFDFPIS